MHRQRYSSHQIAAELRCSPAAIGRALNEKLAEHTYHVCYTLFGAKGTVEGAEFMVGSIAGEPGRSLRVHLTGAKAGRWKDFAAGHGGTMLDLIRDHKRLTHFMDVCSEAVDILRLPITPLPEKDSAGSPVPTSSPKKDATDWLWKKTVFAIDTAAGRYLIGRGFRPPFPARVRCLKTAKHPETRDQLHIAIVALVTDAADKPIGLHRIFVDQEGHKLGTVKEPKCAYGAISGGAVRLTAHMRDTVIIGEGLEDGGSLLGAAPDWPVWYGPTAAHLAAVQLPPWVKRLVVACQNDGPGLMAARKLQLRLHETVAVEILPSMLKDWNLDQQQHGLGFLRERLLSLLPQPRDTTAPGLVPVP